MSAIPKIKKKKVDSILEDLGLKYFNYISQKSDFHDEISIKDIPSDKVLHTVSSNITIYTVVIAFLVGALTTAPSVLFEIYYKSTLTPFHYYTILILITLLLLILEVSILYWLSMRSGYTLAELMGYDEKHQKNLPSEYDIKKIMIRSALELDDLNIEYLGIKLDKNISKSWVVISSLLYKAKIVLSSTLIRILLTKLFSRHLLRVGFVWVSVPVTAIWDAIVMYRVIKDTRLRLYGYHLSLYIVKDILNNSVLQHYNQHTIEGLIRAVSTMVVLSKNYHPNNIILLIRLSDNFNITEGKDYDNLEFFLKFLEESSPQERHLFRSFSAIASVFDGELNREEKKALFKIFGEEYSKYMKFTQALKSLLLQSRIHQAGYICKEQINLIV